MNQRAVGGDLERPGAALCGFRDDINSTLEVVLDSDSQRGGMSRVRVSAASVLYVYGNSLIGREHLGGQGYSWSAPGRRAADKIVGNGGRSFRRRLKSCAEAKGHDERAHRSDGSWKVSTRCRVGVLLAEAGGSQLGGDR